MSAIKYRRSELKNFSRKIPRTYTEKYQRILPSGRWVKHFLEFFCSLLTRRRLPQRLAECIPRCQTSQYQVISILIVEDINPYRFHGIEFFYIHLRFNWWISWLSSVEPGTEWTILYCFLDLCPHFQPIISDWQTFQCSCYTLMA